MRVNSWEQKNKGDKNVMTEQRKERFINLDEVIFRTGIKKTTIYNQMKKGLFPNSIYIGLNRTVWLESQIDEWIADKIKNNE